MKQFAHVNNKYNMKWLPKDKNLESKSMEAKPKQMKKSL